MTEQELIARVAVAINRDAKAPRENQILREPEVRRRTGLSHSTLWRLRKQDRFPKPIRLSPQLIGWLVSDIDGWLAELVAERG